MQEERIAMTDIIGKTITDIRCKYGEVDGWLDTAYSYIQLDGQCWISIPYGLVHDVLLTEPDPDATSIFTNLSDIPIYHVNKEGKSIAEVTAAHKKRKQKLINRIRKFFFGYEPPLIEYQPYKVEYQENKLKHIINRTITDFLWSSNDPEKRYFELDNGYLITEQYMAPTGTGLAGLHYYVSFNHVKLQEGDKISRYSNYNK
ncbi:MAG: hypothetical protein NTW29_16620 [Bacteroidetes bacterium]|nr:hypothetical protein [Bacteroidota bacterium]